MNTLLFCVMNYFVTKIKCETTFSEKLTFSCNSTAYTVLFMCLVIFFLETKHY